MLFVKSNFCIEANCLEWIDIKSFCLFSVGKILFFQFWSCNCQFGCHPQNQHGMVPTCIISSTFQYICSVICFACIFNFFTHWIGNLFIFIIEKCVVTFGHHFIIGTSQTQENGFVPGWYIFFDGVIELQIGYLSGSISLTVTLISRYSARNL